MRNRLKELFVVSSILFVAGTPAWGPLWADDLHNAIAARISGGPDPAPGTTKLVTTVRQEFVCAFEMEKVGKTSTHDLWQVGKKRWCRWGNTDGPPEWHAALLGIARSVDRHRGEAGLTRQDRAKMLALSKSLRLSARILKDLYL